MDIGRPTNSLIQSEPTYELLELIHLEVYSTQPMIIPYNFDSGIDL